MRKIIVILILLGTVVYGCKKSYEEKAIGAPLYTSAQLLDQLNGKWIMSQATQIDEKSLTKEAVDITDFYTSELGSQAPNISFKTSDHTYTSDTAGVALDYFGTGGTWAFDDNDYPTKITLNTGTKTIEIPIGSSIQTKGGYLEYTEGAKCGTDAAMTFKLKLTKQ